MKSGRKWYGSGPRQCGQSDKLSHPLLSGHSSCVKSDCVDIVSVSAYHSVVCAALFSWLVSTGVSIKALLESMSSIWTEISMDRNSESARTPKKWGTISSLTFCAGSKLHINKLKKMNAFVFMLCCDLIDLLNEIHE